MEQMPSVCEDPDLEYDRNIHYISTRPLKIIGSVVVVSASQNIDSSSTISCQSSTVSCRSSTVSCRSSTVSCRSSTLSADTLSVTDSALEDAGPLDWSDSSWPVSDERPEVPRCVLGSSPTEEKPDLGAEFPTDSDADHTPNNLDIYMSSPLSITVKELNFSPQPRILQSRLAKTPNKRTFDDRKLLLKPHVKLQRLEDWLLKTIVSKESDLNDVVVLEKNKKSKSLSKKKQLSLKCKGKVGQKCKKKLSKKLKLQTTKMMKSSRNKKEVTLHLKNSKLVKKQTAKKSGDNFTILKVKKQTAPPCKKKAIQSEKQQASQHSKKSALGLARMAKDVLKDKVTVQRHKKRRPLPKNQPSLSQPGVESCQQRVSSNGQQGITKDVEQSNQPDSPKGKGQSNEKTTKENQAAKDVIKQVPQKQKEPKEQNLEILTRKKPTKQRTVTIAEAKRDLQILSRNEKEMPKHNLDEAVKPARNQCVSSKKKTEKQYKATAVNYIYRCPLCLRTFPTVTRHKAHMYDQHSITTNREGFWQRRDSASGRLLSPPPSRVLKGPQGIPIMSKQQHQLRISRSLECNHCAYSLKTSLDEQTKDAQKEKSSQEKVQNTQKKKSNQKKTLKLPSISAASSSNVVGSSCPGSCADLIALEASKQTSSRIATDRSCEMFCRVSLERLDVSIIKKKSKQSENALSSKSQRNANLNTGKETHFSGVEMCQDDLTPKTADENKDFTCKFCQDSSKTVKFSAEDKCDTKSQCTACSSEPVKDIEECSACSENPVNEKPTLCICPSCGCAFFSQDLLENHMRLCHQSFDKTNSAVAWEKYHNDPEQLELHRQLRQQDGSLKCPKCPREYLTYDGIELHYRDAHNELLPHRCDSCQIGFLFSAKLEAHRLRFHQTCTCSPIAKSRIDESVQTCTVSFQNQTTSNDTSAAQTSPIPLLVETDANNKDKHQSNMIDQIASIIQRMIKAENVENIFESTRTSVVESARSLPPVLQSCNIPEKCHVTRPLCSPKVSSPTTVCDESFDNTLLRNETLETSKSLTHWLSDSEVIPDDEKESADEAKDSIKEVFTTDEVGTVDNTLLTNEGWATPHWSHDSEVVADDSDEEPMFEVIDSESQLTSSTSELIAQTFVVDDADQHMPDVPFASSTHTPQRQGPYLVVEEAPTFDKPDSTSEDNSNRSVLEYFCPDAECSFTSTDVNSILFHIRFHVGEMSARDLLYYTVPLGLPYHIQTSSSVSKNASRLEYQCPECTMKFFGRSSKAALTQHLKRHRVLAMVYGCPLVTCRFSSTELGEVAEHCDSVHKELQCDKKILCATLPVGPLVMEHSPRVTKEVYRCPVSYCRYSSPSDGLVKSHLAGHTCTLSANELRGYRETGLSAVTVPWLTHTGADSRQPQASSMCDCPFTWCLYSTPSEATMKNHLMNMHEHSLTAVQREMFQTLILD